MERPWRTIVAVAAVCLVVIGILGFYSPATADASTPVTASEPTDSVTVTERILLEDEVVFVSKESTIDTETGAQRQVLAFENVAYDHYWTGDGESYTKLTAADEATFERVTEETNGELREQNRSEYTAVVASDSVDPAEKPRQSTYPDRLVHSQLEMTTYEHVRTETVDGTEVDVYEPKSGWTTIDSPADARDDSMYLSNASGELAVEADGTLRRSNVTLEGVQAETWGDYLRERLGDETWSVTVEYDRDREPGDPTPEWAGELETE